MLPVLQTYHLGAAKRLFFRYFYGLVAYTYEAYLVSLFWWQLTSRRIPKPQFNLL